MTRHNSQHNTVCWLTHHPPPQLRTTCREKTAPMNTSFDSKYISYNSAAVSRENYLGCNLARFTLDSLAWLGWKKLWNAFLLRGYHTWNKLLWYSPFGTERNNQLNQQVGVTFFLQDNQLNSVYNCWWAKPTIVGHVSTFFWIYRIVLNKRTCASEHALRPSWQPTPKFWWNLPQKQVKMDGKWLKTSLLFSWAPWSLLGVCQHCNTQGAFIQHNMVPTVLIAQG